MSTCAAIPCHFLDPILTLAENPDKIDLQRALLHPLTPSAVDPYSIFEIQLKPDANERGVYYQLSREWKDIHYQYNWNHDSCRSHIGDSLKMAVRELSERVSLVEMLDLKKRSHELEKQTHVLTAQIRAIIGLGFLSFAFMVKSTPAAFSVGVQSAPIVSVAFAVVGVAFLVFALISYKTSTSFRKTSTITPPNDPFVRRAVRADADHAIASVFVKALSDYRKVSEDHKWKNFKFYEYKDGVTKSFPADNFLYFLRDCYSIKITDLTDETKARIGKFVADTVL